MGFRPSENDTIDTPNVAPGLAPSVRCARRPTARGTKRYILPGNAKRFEGVNRPA
jgi:hypothetical protein